MRIAILTTQTPHHSYFVQSLAREHEISAIVVEREGIRAPFETAHPFETERDAYECKKFFSEDYPELKTFAATLTAQTINDSEVLEFLKTQACDVAVVFGTRRIKPALIQLFPNRILNLHGGDPEEYRGLDTHLWAVYHDDYSQLITTLHQLNETLDDGAIIGRKQLQLTVPGMKLSQLRALNTQACIDLTKEALEDYQQKGEFFSVQQTRRGRYYSFMPTCLKEICVKKFERHTQQLR